MKAIHVALDKFTITVSTDGKTVRTIDRCSFGRAGHHTPTIPNGALSPTKRDKVHHSTIYHGALMPYALFFQQAPTCAFHQGDTHVASHGCIHLAADDAKWLFEWAGHDPVALQIVGPYPANPVSPHQQAAPAGAPAELPAKGS